MMVILKIFKESILQTFQELNGNRLRTFLSLLGITIGILCVITVLSAVDSLEKNVKESVNKLGDNVVYVQKWPWSFTDPNYAWWEYMKRPTPKMNDFKAIQKSSQTSEASAIIDGIGGLSAVYKSNSLEDVQLNGMTIDYNKIWDMEFAQGRYFTNNEAISAKNVAVIGAEIATQLFGDNIDPLGKEFKVKGNKFMIIGVLKREGTTIVGDNFDDVVLVPWNTYMKSVKIQSREISIMVKAKENVSLKELKAELTQILRAERRLRPKEDNDFALNQASLIAGIMDSVFGTVNIAGWIIGIFAIIVGGFGIANIMFVSVKERTNIIGIKKALGARNFVILLEFLIEAIILCLIGGVLGLILVYLFMLLATNFAGFEFVLSTNNVIIGLSISSIIGIVSGIIPAYQASRLDCVEAMRSV